MEGNSARLSALIRRRSSGAGFHQAIEWTSEPTLLRLAFARGAIFAQRDLAVGLPAEEVPLVERMQRVDQYRGARQG